MVDDRTLTEEGWLVWDMAMDHAAKQVKERFGTGGWKGHPEATNAISEYIRGMKRDGKSWKEPTMPKT